MKNLLLILFLVLFTISANAVDYATAGTGGQWDLNATWNVGGSYPDDAADNAILNNNDSVWLPAGVTITVSEIEFGNNSILFIPATTTLIADSISVLNNAKFYIEGTLSLVGGINMRNNSSLDISLTGSLAVGGDFYGSNNVTIDNDGDMDITGDLYLGAGAALTGEGTVSADTYSGAGTVFGSDMGDLTGGEIYYAGAGGAYVLPIELTVLKAYKNTNSITIYWQTATEENNDFFAIERSSDGVNYELIGSVEGAGNSSSSLDYTYIDKNPLNGVSYYRLTQTDYNGVFEVFDPISVSFLNEEALHIGPNPAINEINVSINGEMGTGNIYMYNVIGAQVKSLNLENNITTIDVSDLPSGTYLVVFSANDNKITRRIILQ